MLSDADFNSPKNAEDVVNEVVNMVNFGGVGFMLFKLDGKDYQGNDIHNYCTDKLEENGIPVFYLSSIDDFMNKAVRFNREFYGEVVSKC